MGKIEDYKLIRDEINAHILLKYRYGKEVSIAWAFDMIFSFALDPDINLFFSKSQLILQKYIQSNKLTREDLKELRRRLDFYILDYSSFEEMIDKALDYSLSAILYVGIPEDFEDFRDFHNIKLWASSSEERKARRITQLNADKYIKNKECIIPSSVEVIKSDAFKSKEIMNVIIPNSVTYIWDYAFANNQLESVIIPYNVKEIGFCAFFHNKLKSLIILGSLDKINFGAFAHNELKSLTLPNSVTHIGDSNSITKSNGPLPYISIPTLQRVPLGITKDNIIGAFEHNELKSLTIPNSVTHIGDSAFKNNQLDSLTIPDSVSHIGNAAFANNELKSLTIPNSVTYIGDSAFAGNKLTSVIIPQSLKQVGCRTFYGNNLTSIRILGEETRFDKAWKEIGFPISLNPRLYEYNGFTVEIKTGKIINFEGKEKEVIIPKQINNVLITNISEGTFSRNELKKLTIPNSVTHIGNEAFAYNYLENLTIPNSVTHIGDRAFAHNELKSLTIPNSVTHIEKSAFRNNKLKSVTIPESVKTIGELAFYANPLSEIIITKFRQKPILLKALQGEKIKIKVQLKIFNFLRKNNSSNH